MRRLNLESLDVETFEPVAPAPAVVEDGGMNPVIWTGCMSECTECGMGESGMGCTFLPQMGGI